MAGESRGGAQSLVLLGASAGGVDVLATIVAGLPPNLPAAVLVVLHVPSWGTSVLPAILDRAGPLPSRHAEDGDILEPGRVYVAPPDRHLVTEGHHVRLHRTPKENGVRPSIDTLFRSAAQSHGRDVIAVVLSGALDDGTAGLVSVNGHGGVTIAQDPAEALFPSMPESAVRYAKPDHVVPAGEIAPLIVDYVEGDRLPLDRGLIRKESEPLDPDDSSRAAAADQNGSVSGLNCPDCGGSLWEMGEGELMRFRCRVGHAYSPESLFARQLESLEGALWAAVVALHERADLASRLAGRMAERARPGQAVRFERQAADARERAEQVRAAIVQLSRHDDPAGDGDRS